MRELYGLYKKMLENRKTEYFDWKKKQENFKYREDQQYVLIFPDFFTPQEIEDYFEEIKRNPNYSRFADRYVDKMWLDEANWKIAYDVWMSKGKPYNKFSIQIYHKLLKYVIPFLEERMKDGKRVKCDRLLSEGIDSPGFDHYMKPCEYFRAAEFAMATVYDTQKYKYYN